MTLSTGIRSLIPKDAPTSQQERAYTTLNGYRDDDMAAYVYRTDNLGNDWESIGEGLPAEPINVIREDPENEDVLYLGTDRGVYVSLEDTVRGFKEILEGKHDDLPEQAFFMVGSIEDACAKAKTL